MQNNRVGMGSVTVGVSNFLAQKATEGQHDIDRVRCYSRDSHASSWGEKQVPDRSRSSASIHPTVDERWM